MGDLRTGVGGSRKEGPISGILTVETSYHELQKSPQATSHPHQHPTHTNPHKIHGVRKRQIVRGRSGHPVPGGVCHVAFS